MAPNIIHTNNNLLQQRSIWLKLLNLKMSTEISRLRKILRNARNARIMRGQDLARSLTQRNSRRRSQVSINYNK